jgi:ribosomal protein L11 methyltransferase
LSDSAYRITLPCSRAEAEGVGDAELDGAALVATEEDEAAGRWRLDAYVEGEPSAALVAAVRALAPAGGEPRVERLADADWVAMSQAGLEPVREGRFVVHTSAFPADAPPGGRAFLIEAAQAFGTGHHATTAGCLAMLDRLAGERFASLIDLGTGTGLLAFAARVLWPQARVLATDLDPVAIEAARENAAANGIGGVDLLVADGTRDPAIAERAPYELVIANILAGPLIAMAPEIVSVTRPGGAILLAGLLSTQADAVLAAYTAQGCTEAAREVRGDWTILLLRAGERPASAAAPAGDREGWAADR